MKPPLPPDHPSRMVRHAIEEFRQVEERLVYALEAVRGARRLLESIRTGALTDDGARYFRHRYPPHRGPAKGAARVLGVNGGRMVPGENPGTEGRT